MEAVVIGGTGLVGSILIEELISDERFTKIISIGRKPIQSTSNKFFNINIKDLTEISNVELEVGHSVFFCSIGSTIKKAGSQQNFRNVDFTAVVEFAKLAKKYNSSKFLLVSAKGADSKSKFFYNKTKGEAENALQNLGLKSVTVFRPGLLIGDRNEFRFFELISIVIVKGLSSILGYERLKPIVTSAKGLARAMMNDSLVAETGYKIVDSSKI